MRRRCRKLYRVGKNTGRRRKIALTITVAVPSNGESSDNPQGKAGTLFTLQREKTLILFSKIFLWRHNQKTRKGSSMGAVLLQMMQSFFIWTDDERMPWSDRNDICRNRKWKMCNGAFTPGYDWCWNCSNLVKWRAAWLQQHFAQSKFRRANFITFARLSTNLNQESWKLDAAPGFMMGAMIPYFTTLINLGRLLKACFAAGVSLKKKQLSSQ